MSFCDIGFWANETRRESKTHVKSIVPQRTLSDTRDSNSYTVRKLADGKCWMTQNLRLVGSRTLTSSDSDVTSNFTLTASDSSTWCDSDNATCVNKSMILNSGNSSYGTYYNWYAATAGTGKYETTSGNAASSVCPKGWKLPTGGGSSEFQALYSKYNTPTKVMSANGPAIVLSGYRYQGNTVFQNSNSIYWSSTPSGNAYGFILNGDSSVFYTTNGGNKYLGATVRCLAR